VSHNAWSQSQTKRTTIKKDNKKKKKESINFEEKLTGDIMVGNLTFFNGLYISSKFTVGYKISDRFSTGLGGKLFYQQISQQGKDPSITDIGSLLFVRGKITSSIYAQAEYNLTAFGDLTQFNLPLPAKTVFYPTIGLGYHSGEGKWSYHAQLLYIANSTAQDYINVVEYWVGAAYNF
jgi:hypothetical protein